MSTFDIEEALARSERRAKRAWIFSIAWVGTMLIFSAIFLLLIYQINKTREELDTLKTTADELIDELNDTKTEMKLKLGEQSKHIYALNLQAVGLTNLSDEQKEFIKRQADEALHELPTPETLSEQAQADYVSGEEQAALDEYSDALVRDPKYWEAYFGRGNVDIEMNKFEEANNDFTQALRFSNDTRYRPALLARRVNALIRLYRFDDAKVDIAEVLASGDPRATVIALSWRGFIKLMEKDWDGAEADFKAAAPQRLSGRTAELENIGLIYLAEGDWSKAYSWSYETEQKSDGSGGWMWLIEAIAAKKLGKQEDSKVALAKYMDHIKSRSGSREFEAFKFYVSPDVAEMAQQLVDSTRN